MKKLFAVALLLMGCGYSAHGFLPAKYQTINITQVKNEINITGENQESGAYRSLPPLLENKFKTAVLDRVNREGRLKPVTTDGDLNLKVVLRDYVRDTLRFGDSDVVNEYRIKLFFDFVLTDSSGEIIAEESIVADEDYALNGSSARSEESAIFDLFEDAARRLVQEIIEPW